MTVSQEISRSGWWPIDSAGSTRLGDEVDRADEVAALERLRIAAPVALPAGRLGQPLLDLGVAQQRHRGLCCHGSRIGRNERLPPHPLAHRVSHYSEKARWALAYKGVEHERRAPLPGAHIAVALWLTRGASTRPSRCSSIDGREIGDSTAIIAALEERYPEPPLYPADPEQRRRALELEDFFDEELGPHVRLLAFHELREDPERLAALIANRRRPAR